ncbi:MAG: tetratricopeptide repeat protein, partial [Acidobacteriota bacterium]
MSARAKTTAALLFALAAGLPTAAGQPEERARGEVTAVDGETIVVAVRTGPTPRVGDSLSVMEPFGEGHAASVGRWRVSAVLGATVRATREESFGGHPAVGMEALFDSRRGDGYVDGPDVAVPGPASSGVRGNVIEARGREVTVRLLETAVPAVGDKVELSFAVGEDAIAVGTWRVTAVRPDGAVDAAAVEALAAPTTSMDATVWASGSRADALVQQANAVRATDPSRALEIYVQAAAQGHAEAAEQAGIAFMEGYGTPQNDARAAPLLRQAAEAGRPRAQNAYGVLVSLGRGGLAQDNAAATAWYRKAAAQDFAQGQSNLCHNYLFGEGVERNEAEAFRLCTLAAAQERASALDLLGWMYQNGLGTAKDLTQAFRHYERAARLGWANSQNNLGFMYENGWGVDRDTQQALHWYRQSAAQGNPWSEWNLGRMYQDGVGVTVDQ